MKKYALALICLLGSFAFAASETKDFDAQGLEEVKIENTSGKVEINAVEGTKATVITNKRKFADTCKITMARSGKQLSIKVEGSDSFFSHDDCNVDFEVKVPKVVDLDVTTGSGIVKVSGTQGALEFKVGSGDTNAVGTFKKIDGKTGSGNVKIQGLTGGGELRSGSGEIDLKYAAGTLKGELELRTGSGDAVVQFPKGTKIKTNFKAGSGEMSNELGDNPDAAFKLSMKAGSGNLRVKSY